MKQTFPHFSEGCALHCAHAPAERSAAPLFSASAPREGVTTVPPLARLSCIDSLPPWGGPAEAA